MIAAIPSATLHGVEGRPVYVEVHVSNGLPCFSVVGLPDAACRESRDRVRAALLSSELSWPLRRVTVNLAPSSVRKVGAGLDLAVAVGLLVATGQLEPSDVTDCGFVGELGLDGSIRRVPGVLPLVAATRSSAVVVPFGSVREARLVAGKRVRAVRSLLELLDALRGRAPWPPLPEERPDETPAPDLADLAEVRGQLLGRRALEVAAAGGHHLLISGPPGSGKTMLANRLVGLLPALTAEQVLETSRIHSSAGLSLAEGSLVRRAPFRAPHHSASAASLLGGGAASMRPGEISLATNGVLFLDELGEFPTHVLDSLRQPIEEGVVRVARARASVTFPARFLLVAAMNPCPCGEGVMQGGCRCTPTARERYVRRLTGPLLDRFDLQVTVERPSIADLLGTASGEPSARVARRVALARRAARARGVACNSMVASSRLDALTPLSSEARKLLESRLRSGELSARGLDRVRRVSLTIADLERVGGGADAGTDAGARAESGGADVVLRAEHVAEALVLRAGRDVLTGRALR